MSKAVYDGGIGDKITFKQELLQSYNEPIRSLCNYFRTVKKENPIIDFVILIITIKTTRMKLTSLINAKQKKKNIQERDEQYNLLYNNLRDFKQSDYNAVLIHIKSFFDDSNRSYTDQIAEIVKNIDKLIALNKLIYSEILPCYNKIYSEYNRVTEKKEVTTFFQIEMKQGGNLSITKKKSRKILKTNKKGSKVSRTSKKGGKVSINKKRISQNKKTYIKINNNKKSRTKSQK